jgi:hypothetical protein
MPAKHLTLQECTEARQQAQRIQKTINAAAGPRFARCTAPIQLRPGDLTSADQDPRYGLELRIEPLEMMTVRNRTKCAAAIPTTAVVARLFRKAVSRSFDLWL